MVLDIFKKKAEERVMLPSAPSSDNGATTFPLSMVKEVHDVENTGTYYLKIDNGTGVSHYIKSANSPEILDNAKEQYRIESALMTSGGINDTAKRIIMAIDTYNDKGERAHIVADKNDKDALTPVAIILEDRFYVEPSEEEFISDIAAFKKMGQSIKSFTVQDFKTPAERQAALNNDEPA